MNMILPIYRVPDVTLNNLTYYWSRLLTDGELFKEKCFIRIELNYPFPSGVIFEFPRDCVRYVIEEQEKDQRYIYHVARCDREILTYQDVLKFREGRVLYRKGILKPKR